jgi:hypothetical protein
VEVGGLRESWQESIVGVRIEIRINSLLTQKTLVQIGAHGCRNVCYYFKSLRTLSANRGFGCKNDMEMSVRSFGLIFGLQR